MQRLYSIDTVTQQPGIKEAVLVKKVKDFELDADELCRVLKLLFAKNKKSEAEKIEALNDHTVRMTLKAPFAPFIMVTLCHGPGAIVCEAATEAAGGRFTTRPGSRT